eukprot:GHRQ01027612.1.p2 GENE.GHRQ01027612.1~~GHRQ01027612.1.p2  ORF type:complete len:136 (+),score=21.46 GHRQ01027612.1:370-777(+)
MQNHMATIAGDSACQSPPTNVQAVDSRVCLSPIHAGDNRDATYLSALPMVTLNRPGQVLLVAGLNYVAEDEASYMNVAITDPLQQTGLLAFDDEELRQAAQFPDLVLSNVSRVENTPSLHNLFVVAFSRDCSGVF